MKTSTLLESAWRRIDNPAKWTKRTFARDAFGDKVPLALKPAQHPLFPQEAVQFDTLGALYCANQDQEERGDLGEAMHFLKVTAMSLSPKPLHAISLAAFNDELGSYEELKTWWEKTIKVARAAEAY